MEAGCGGRVRGQYSQGGGRAIGEAFALPEQHGGRFDHATPRPHLELLRGKGGAGVAGQRGWKGYGGMLTSWFL